MSLWPVPDVMKEELCQLSPRLFTNRGIRFLLLDIDNTLAPYTIDSPPERIKAWVRDMQAAGLELFLLSNNRGERPERFSEALGLPYVKRAWKPFPKTARAVMEQYGFSPGETAVIGDQIYTDTLCARLCGAFAVTVKPIAFSNVWLRLRYWAEMPFRWRYQWKHTK